MKKVLLRLLHAHSKAKVLQIVEFVERGSDVRARGQLALDESLRCLLDDRRALVKEHPQHLWMGKINKTKKRKEKEEEEDEEEKEEEEAKRSFFLPEVRNGPRAARHQRGRTGR